MPADAVLGSLNRNINGKTLVSGTNKRNGFIRFYSAHIVQRMRIKNLIKETRGNEDGPICPFHIPNLKDTIIITIIVITAIWTRTRK
jgi:hypothetical protein